jgi:hypothetical protein
MKFRPSIASVLAFGLALGVVATTSCEEHNDGDLFDEAPLTADQRDACTDYCNEATACDDELDLTECNDSCVDALESCFESNVDDAAAELRSCVDEPECLDVVQCSFQVSGECFFGT